MKTVHLPISPGLIPAVALLGLSVSLLWLSQDFGHSSGMFPRFIGALFVGLCLLEVVAQSAASIRKSDDTPFSVNPALITRPIAGLSWIVGFLTLVYLLGFVVAVPLFIFAFLRLSGQHTWLLSIAIAAGSLLFVYLIFIILLNYELFPGILMPD